MSELLDTIINQVRLASRDANAERYLTAIGTVLLLYDHFLTIGKEVELVWKAKNTFTKFAFLVNRYLVPVMLILVCHFMTRFDGEFTTQACQHFFGAAALIGILSVGIADVLVLKRVVALWDHNENVMQVLAVGFFVSFFTTLTFMSLTLKQILPSMTYTPVVHICFTSNKTSFLVATWASPLAFEFFVLILTCWNAFDRPRGGDTDLTKVLLRDGILYFLALSSLRLLNLIMAAISPPSRIMLGAFFVWALVTVVLNRALLNMQLAELIPSTRFKRKNSSDIQPPTPMQPLTQSWHSRDFLNLTDSETRCPSIPASVVLQSPAPHSGWWLDDIDEVFIRRNKYKQGRSFFDY